MVGYMQMLRITMSSPSANLDYTVSELTLFVCGEGFSIIPLSLHLEDCVQFDSVERHQGKLEITRTMISQVDDRRPRAK